ncbi:MAG: hypothetical protein ABI894_07240 [Ilumatobacteraceae bacterium]
MIKRMTWFFGGAVAGVAGVGMAKRKMKRAATHFTPKHVVHKVRGRVHDAYAEGRSAMRSREVELRAQLDLNAASLADAPEDGDALADGQPVQPGQVIVLKQVRDRSKDRGKRRA